MRISFKKGVVDSFNVVDENGKKLFDVAKRSVMGYKYSVMKSRKKIASIERNAYNISQAYIFIGDEKIGFIERDWTNKLTIKLTNKWYISSNKDGYSIRSYGKIEAKVDCKYGLAEKYIVDVCDEDHMLEVVCVVLALDMINYEVER